MPLEPGEAVTVVKSQELVQVLAIPGKSSAYCPWHKSGSSRGPVREPAGICRTTGTDLCLGVIAKGYSYFFFRLKRMNILEDRENSNF